MIIPNICTQIPSLNRTKPFKTLSFAYAVFILTKRGKGSLQLFFLIRELNQMLLYLGKNAKQNVLYNQHALGYRQIRTSCISCIHVSGKRRRKNPREIQLYLSNPVISAANNRPRCTVILLNPRLIRQRTNAHRPY